MSDKYLPIGSVVEIGKTLKKIMIIGYFSVECLDTIKSYDYIGCIYPEGLLQNQFFSFNHSDIKKIEFIGYKNSDFNNLNILLDKNNNIDMPKVKSKSSKNLEFDENKVVVKDTLSENNKIINNLDLKNPFEIESNNVPIQSTPKIVKKYNFNSDGIVTEDSEALKDIKNIENNFSYKFDEFGNVINEVSKSENTNQYKFDNNDYVIDDSVDSSKLNNTQSSNFYKFNQDGVVIDDENTNQEFLNSDTIFKFDSNGNVISDGSQNKANNKYTFDSNGNVIEETSNNSIESTQKNQYKFDNNGMVIED